MNETTWLETMRARPVHPLRRLYSACTYYRAGRPDDTAPPTGLEGFGRGLWRTTVLWMVFPILVSHMEWASADGRILAIATGGKLFLQSQLADGSALVTWPGDPQGRILAARGGSRLSLVGTGDVARDVAQHRAAVAELEAAGAAAIAFETAAARDAAAVLYDLHNTNLWTAGQVAAVNGFTVFALVVGTVRWLLT